MRSLSLIYIIILKWCTLFLRSICAATNSPQWELKNLLLSIIGRLSTVDRNEKPSEIYKIYLNITFSHSPPVCIPKLGALSWICLYILFMEDSIWNAGNWFFQAQKTFRIPPWWTQLGCQVHKFYRIIDVFQKYRTNLAKSLKI